MIKVGRHAFFGALVVGVLAAGNAAHAGSLDSYLQSAHEYEKARDFKSAEIQLRNALEADPGNGAVCIELAKVYLAMGNPNSAQAELYAAHSRGVHDDVIAPLMAQAMLDLGQYGDLLKNVPAGNRPAGVESIIRTYRGLAYLGLNETASAEEMLSDAERLDPNSIEPKIAHARLLMAKNKVDQATGEVASALAKAPHNSAALEMRGVLYQLHGQVNQALGQFSAAIAADPRNVRALLDRTQIELGLKQLDKAEADLKSAEAIAPGGALALFMSAQLNALRGNYRAADDQLNKLRGVMNSMPQIYLLAAEVKLKLNQPAVAEDYLNKLIAQNPNEARGYKLLGVMALGRHDYAHAVAFLEHAHEIAPKDAQTSTLLAQAYAVQGDIQKSKSALDQAAANAPNDQKVQAADAIGQLAVGDTQAGMTKLTAAFKGGAGDLSAGPPLVIAAIRSGRLDLALATAQALYKRDPSNVVYEQLLALALSSQRNYAQAEKLWRDILAKKPSTSARNNLAQVYVATNRAADARKLFQDALQQNPNAVPEMIGLAGIDIQLKNYDEASKLLTRAESMSPKDPAAGVKLTSVYAMQKNWPAALTEAKALQTRFPNDPNVIDALGRVYFQSGDLASSAATYQAAISKFPKSSIFLQRQAAILLNQKQYGKAIAPISSAIALEPANGHLKADLIVTTFLAKGASAALGAAESSLPAGAPPEPYGAITAASVLEQAGHRADAIAIVSAVQKKSGSGQLVVLLASLYARDNNAAKGVTVLESWTKDHPADKEARFALAQLYSIVGKPDMSIAQYEWLNSQSPNNMIILNNLAWLYSQKHDPRAKATAQAAQSLAPKSAVVADTLGWILLAGKENAAALNYLKQASDGSPNDSEVQYHYAVALAANGKKSDAAGAIARALKLPAPADVRVKEQTLSSQLGSAH
jgi:putative PEP-CTERM system TPR-repeat lipoprotein